jgi:hypothetical protein
MYEGIRILRPMDKFQGKQRMPGDFVPASELASVSLATLESLKNIGSIMMVSAGAPVSDPSDSTERVGRVEARVDALTDAITSLVQRLDRIAAAGAPKAVVRRSPGRPRKVVKPSIEEGTPNGDDTASAT